MMDSTPNLRPRKTPFATLINFTVARLTEEADRIQALGITHVEYSCKSSRGLKAVIYGGDGQVTLYSRYCLNKRPVRERLGKAIGRQLGESPRIPWWLVGLSQASMAA